MDIDEAGNEIARMEGVLAEHAVHVRDLQVQSDCLIINDYPLKLIEQSWAAFCSAVDAPLSYVRRLDPDIRAAVMQRHLHRGDLGSTITVIEEEGRLVAFDRMNLVRLRVSDVFNAVAESLGCNLADMEISNLRLRPASSQFQLLSVNRLKNEVVPGDVVRAGLSIMHSPVGAHPTWVEAYLERLVCSNGMLHRDHVGRRKPRTRRLPVSMPGARDMQLDQVRRLATEAFATLEQKLTALESLRDERVDVETVFKSWLERAQLSVGVLMPLLLDAWRLEGSDRTAYGVLNAITRVATHSTHLTIRVRQTIARLAGLLAFQGIHLCPTCFSVLRDAA